MEYVSLSILAVGFVLIIVLVALVLAPLKLYSIHNELNLLSRNVYAQLNELNETAKAHSRLLAAIAAAVTSRGSGPAV
jgi:predicted Holliday junction resolvase-like endonuclease